MKYLVCVSVILFGVNSSSGALFDFFKNGFELPSSTQEPWYQNTLQEFYKSIPANRQQPQDGSPISGSDGLMAMLTLGSLAVTGLAYNEMGKMESHIDDLENSLEAKASADEFSDKSDVLTNMIGKMEDNLEKYRVFQIMEARNDSEFLPIIRSARQLQVIFDQVTPPSNTREGRQFYDLKNSFDVILTALTKVITKVSDLNDRTTAINTDIDITAVGRTPIKDRIPLVEDAVTDIEEDIGLIVGGVLVDPFTGPDMRLDTLEMALGMTELPNQVDDRLMALEKAVSGVKTRAVDELDYDFETLGTIKSRLSTQEVDITGIKTDLAFTEPVDSSSGGDSGSSCTDDYCRMADLYFCHQDADGDGILTGAERGDLLNPNVYIIGSLALGSDLQNLDASIDMTKQEFIDYAKTDSTIIDRVNSMSVPKAFGIDSNEWDTLNALRCACETQPFNLLPDDQTSTLTYSELTSQGTCSDIQVWMFGNSIPQAIFDQLDLADGIDDEQFITLTGLSNTDPAYKAIFQDWLDSSRRRDAIFRNAVQTTNDKIKAAEDTVKDIELDIDAAGIEAGTQKKPHARMDDINADITAIKADIGSDLNTRVITEETSVTTILTDIGITEINLNDGGCLTKTPPDCDPAHESVDTRLTDIKTEIATAKTDIDLGNALGTVASRLTSLEAYQTSVEDGLDSVATETQTHTDNIDTSKFYQLGTKMSELQSYMNEYMNDRQMGAEEIKMKIKQLEQQDWMMSYAVMGLNQQSSCTVEKIKELSEMVLNKQSPAVDRINFSTQECIRDIKL